MASITPAGPMISIPPGKKISVTHDSMPNGYVSTLRYRRPIESIIAASREKIDELLFPMWNDATDLPELNALYALRGKRFTIDNELARVQLDLEQLSIDRKRAVADLSGEILAKKLTKIDAERKVLMQRIEDSKTGRQLFEKDIADATELARKAIEAHIDKSFPPILAELKARVEAALSAIEASAPLLEMLDEVAIAERVGLLVRGGGFGPKIKEILAPPVEAID